MPFSIDDLEAAGLTPEQVIRIWKMVEADRAAAAIEEEQQREQWRIRQRRHRERHRDVTVTSRGQSRDIGHIEERKKEAVPLTEVTNVTSVRGRSIKGKRPLPEGWRPSTPIAPEDSAEFDRFCDYARANGRCYSDWDAAWRNWRTSPYRNANGHGGQNVKIKSEADREWYEARGARVRLGPTLAKQSRP